MTCKQCNAVFIGGSRANYCDICRKKKQGERVLENKICKRCKILFTGGPNAQYCSACRIILQAERDKNCYQAIKLGKRRFIGSKDQCIICKQYYIVNSGNQKYCPKCSKND